MNTLRPPPGTRAAFTLMELLAVMLLILTILGMGVPAMFAAERKSYVNQAMQVLIEVHNKCQKLQRELAARGDSGVVHLAITHPGPSNVPVVTVSINGSTTGMNATNWFGRTFPISINADEFISSVTSSTVTQWDYVQQTGFIGSAVPIVLTFNALPTGSTFKVKRLLTLYPQGYSEIP